MDRLYKILIIDDDEYSADNLCLELKRYGQLVVEGIARNGSNGKKMIDKLRPDILFLDVELPDMKGIELLEQINSCVTWNMQVIFYTAYDKYMINAIRESAFDYLLKPIDRKELECIITRFLKKMDEPATPMAIPPQVYSTGEHTFMISTPTNDPVENGARNLMAEKVYAGSIEQSGSPATEKEHHSTSDNRVRSLLCADTSILYHQY